MNTKAEWHMELTTVKGGQLHSSLPSMQSSQSHLIGTPELVFWTCAVFCGISRKISIISSLKSDSFHWFKGGKARLCLVLHDNEPNVTRGTNVKETYRGEMCFSNIPLSPGTLLFILVMLWGGQIVNIFQQQNLFTHFVNMTGPSLLIFGN